MRPPAPVYIRAALSKIGVCISQQKWNEAMRIAEVMAEPAPTNRQPVFQTRVMADFLETLRENEAA